MPSGTASHHAHIHAIGTAVPDHDIHGPYIAWAQQRLADPREIALFKRMAGRAGIGHRWSVLPRSPDGGSPVDAGGFYHGNIAPSTARRMELYAATAPNLAIAAIRDLERQVSIEGVTHLVLASCTGFVAPGVDQIVIRKLGLDPHIERTLVGFMGCYAAVAAMRVAHHIARSEPAARVLVVCVELSSLHLGACGTMEELLAALLFGDGAAAALVSSEPSGLRIDRLFTAALPDSDALIQWNIGDTGFEMVLSGEVPGRINTALHDPGLRLDILGGQRASEIDYAVHAGGRSILDAVEHGLGLDPEALTDSRAVLAANGNMSSATLLFVLARLMAKDGNPNGVAMAFGPGLAAEGFAFSRT
ncbi:type III polyketide synthase [Novosphingobium sp.]|uniref:type III polyketide synthase n=1 Tax=Novosphingobium sp. TaxID=1874826 RepID=UPI0025D034C5|nr:type III polyketide synthase [Novosphingobium sp.]